MKSGLQFGKPSSSDKSTLVAHYKAGSLSGPAFFVVPLTKGAPDLSDYEEIGDWDYWRRSPVRATLERVEGESNMKRPRKATGLTPFIDGRPR